MAYCSKRRKAHQQIDKLKSYKISEALVLVREHSSEKFNPTIDIAIRLGIDPKKSDQVVRGSSVLPHGTGRSVRVAVMTQGDNIQKALDAGADLAGFADLADKITEDAQAGRFDFDVLIASPDAMGQIGKLARVLGPRGLMPNPKTGTVTADVVKAVKNAKAGQVSFRNDKAGIVHTLVGKKSFSDESLRENILALVADIKRLKPSTSKGHFVKKIVLSSTMGPGIQIDVTEF
ncbi:50S ribosomal protein L1 [bacterium]|nr:50S ribosomal protein L1 [bacterium]NBW56404.1 50S ribosomal protein L1 [bacterium]NBX71727.1 50S ribosomal protein L1 [bacterium]